VNAFQQIHGGFHDVDRHVQRRRHALQADPVVPRHRGSSVRASRAPGCLIRFCLHRNTLSRFPGRASSHFRGLRPSDCSLNTADVPWTCAHTRRRCSTSVLCPCGSCGATSGLYFAPVRKLLHDFKSFLLGEFARYDHLLSGRRSFMIRGLAHIYGGAFLPAFCFLSTHTTWLRYGSQPKDWKVFVHDDRRVRVATMKSM